MCEDRTEAVVVQALLLALFRAVDSIYDSDHIIVLELASLVARRTLSVWQHRNRDRGQREERDRARAEDGHVGFHGDTRIVHKMSNSTKLLARESRELLLWCRLGW